MSEASTHREKAIQNHLSSRETAIDGYSNDDLSLAVSKQRLLVIEAGEETDALTRRVESIPFNQTAGVEVETFESGSLDIGLTLVGGLISLVSIGAMLGAEGSPSPSAFMFGGLLGALVGLVVIAIAADTDDGRIELVVHRTGSAPKRTFELAPDAEEFVSHVAKQVAT